LSERGRRSKAPDRINHRIDSCVSAGMATSHGSWYRDMRSCAIMSQGCTNTAAPSAAQCCRKVMIPSSFDVARAHVVADMHADVALGHCPAQLPAGKIGVLQRHLAQGLQPPRSVRADLARGIVEQARALEPLRRRPADRKTAPA